MSRTVLALAVCILAWQGIATANVMGPGGFGGQMVIQRGGSKGTPAEPAPAVTPAPTPETIQSCHQKKKLAIVDPEGKVRCGQ